MKRVEKRKWMFFLVLLDSEEREQLASTNPNSRKKHKYVSP